MIDTTQKITENNGMVPTIPAEVTTTTSSAIPEIRSTSKEQQQQPGTMKTKESRKPFPCKVYDMLEDAADQGFDDVVSWNSSGNGFMVHNKDKFTKEIIPLYFNQTKYKSFQRQLSLYGFERITSGKDKGLRHHDKLQRGNRQLCREMKPIGYKPRGAEAKEKLAAAVGNKDARGNPSTAEDAMASASASTSSSQLNSETRQDTSSNSISVAPAPPMALSPKIPTVISSSSLQSNKDVATTISTLHSEIPHISPDTTPMKVAEISSDEYSTVSSSSEDTMGIFEGMSFYLMNIQTTDPTGVCSTPIPSGISWKPNDSLSLQNPAEGLLTTMSTSTAPTTASTTTTRMIIPEADDIPTLPTPSVVPQDQQLAKAWEIGFAVAMTMSETNQLSEESPAPPILDAAAWNLIDIPNPNAMAAVGSIEAV